MADELPPTVKLNHHGLQSLANNYLTAKRRAKEAKEKADAAHDAYQVSVANMKNLAIELQRQQVEYRTSLNIPITTSDPHQADLIVCVGVLSASQKPTEYQYVTIDQLHTAK